jgi:hypothetical protein
VKTPRPWKGRLCFDRRGPKYLGATIDWARINEMPQWFAVEPDREYSIAVDGAKPVRRTGRRLVAGLEFEVAENGVRRIVVEPAGP